MSVTEIFHCENDASFKIYSKHLFKHGAFASEFYPCKLDFSLAR